MIFDASIIIDEESDITLEYPLYDASNMQIGDIHYVFIEESGKEKFVLYDLDGNLIE